MKTFFQLFGILVVCSIFFASCVKEGETTVGLSHQERFEIEKNNTLADYPSEMTIDNWEEFTYAPQHVIDHFVKIMKSEKSYEISLLSEKECAPIYNNNRTLTNHFLGKATIYLLDDWYVFPALSMEFSPCRVTLETSDEGNYYFNPEGSICKTPLPQFTFVGEVNIIGYDKTANREVENVVDITKRQHINTLDLHLINQHIHGIRTFTSPREYFAADINRDGTINEDDLHMLHRYILGITTGLPEPIVYISKEAYDYAQSQIELNGLLHDWVLDLASSQKVFLQPESTCSQDIRAIIVGSIDDF